MGTTTTASDPLAIFGTVVATVARMLVPNCSAAIVTNMAQKPVPNPSTTQTQYNALDDALCKLKNAITPKTVIILKSHNDFFRLLIHWLMNPISTSPTEMAAYATMMPFPGSIAP